MARTAKRNVLWPRSKLRPLRPKPGDGIVTVERMGVPRWATPSSGCEQHRARGACNGLRLMDARAPFLSGRLVVRPTGRGRARRSRSDFALIDLSKVTHSLAHSPSLNANRMLNSLSSRTESTGERCLPRAVETDVRALSVTRPHDHTTPGSTPPPPPPPAAAAPQGLACASWLEMTTIEGCHLE